MAYLRHRRSQGFSKGGSHCGIVRVLTRLSCRPPRRVFYFKKSFKKRLFNYGQDIVMAFSPPVVGWLKKGLQKEGSRAPQDPPSYALVRDRLSWEVNDAQIEITSLALPVHISSNPLILALLEKLQFQ